MHFRLGCIFTEPKQQFKRMMQTASRQEEVTECFETGNDYPVSGTCRLKGPRDQLPCLGLQAPQMLDSSKALGVNLVNVFGA